ncbi:MAG TPA: lipid IV(A) 3-deoxy-D-manno-octulosonic acid transferase [Coxiellaceae bacterium]|nr:lipid IV(A) 3-deoxy-D-manno-octulosonic acid transferase [Coxiellaceae bacterium]
MLAKITRLLYTIGFYCAIPFIFLRLYGRSLKNKGYGERIAERFGHFKPPLEKCLWIHAVSLGESIAATPLIKQLLAHYPNLPLVITTTTPTGSAHIQKQFENRVYHSYLPFDLPYFIRRFINKIHPQLMIIMETELWPNLLEELKKQHIPVLLANARLSERSCQGYSKVKPLMQSTLSAFTTVCAQSVLDGDRYIQLGLKPNQLMITGNVKFDMPLPEGIKEKAAALRKTWNSQNRLIWIAASTHEGEDEKILKAHHLVQTKFPNALLILVPRHPERFEAVADLCEKNGFSTAKRSRNAVNEQTAILIGDTVGEMILFYAMSDVAFVAGSFKPIGGHNLLEPAALGLPVLTGPELHNFKHISELLFQSGGALLVENELELGHKVIELFQNPTERHTIGQKAYLVVQENRGALEKHLTQIQKILKNPMENSLI